MLTAELPKSYSPAASEPEILDRWDTANAFHAVPDAESEPFCILIPPPNVTAALHLGHAFNNTIQDILARYHRMRGRNTLWMPGTDHAGIATQTVVDKRLQSEGKPSLKDYKKLETEGENGREQFIAKVQEWKDEYEATITEQLKSMGCSCDWQRQRFTMDDICATAVREAFFQLFKDGLIERGKRLVNWDPATQTALADDEVEMQEIDGHFWYLRYPLVHPPENADDPFDCQEVTWSELAARGYPMPEDADHGEDKVAWVTVATTRPETYLGDTAVAVNPKDDRAAALEGLMCQLPIVGRVIPIIEDDYVVQPDPDSSDPKARFATGFLKVTPAHDPNDWEIGRRHNLPMVNVMAPDASISDQHGWKRQSLGENGHVFVGLSREEARQKVVAEFEARGLLAAVKPHRHSVGHSYRTHVPIEPYLSDQWYVKVTDDRLVGEAQRALHENELTFFPSRYGKMYESWHENLRDWCISRQLWWGHRMPVWHIQPATPHDMETSEDYKQQLEDALRKLAQAGGVESNELFSVHVDFNKWHIFVCTHNQFADDLCNKLNDFVSTKALRHPPGKKLDESNALNRPVLFQTQPEQDAAFKIKKLIHSFEQDPDVLDTWFSSALWPLSTMGWPDETSLLNTFNPTTVLCTAREIITLWVSRMVMFNRYFNHGKVPFKDVYIHAMIQDGHGQKMSKSLGNGVDPRDIIHSHGADAMRFTLAQMATSTQDVRMPVDIVCPHCDKTFHPEEMTDSAEYRVAAPEQTCPNCKKEMVSGYGKATGAAIPTKEKLLARNTSSKFDQGRNFANKLWNATRFALTNLDDRSASSSLRSSEAASRDSSDINFSSLSLPDRWIITRLHRTLHTIEDALGDYQISAYAEAMYDFFWRDFCDWYLEAIKPTVKENPDQQQVLRTVLNSILRLLHPICPFVTETLWPHVNGCGFAGLPGIKLPTDDLLATTAWPDIACSVDDEDAAGTFGRIQTLVSAIRTIRAERNVPPKKTITLIADSTTRELIESANGVVEHLAGLEKVLLKEDVSKGESEKGDRKIPFTFEGGELFLADVVEAVDIDAERSRLEKVIAACEKSISGYRNRLANENYVNKAPAHLVDETRAMLAQAEEDLQAATRALRSLD